jgi:hypothetical protein
VNKKITAASAAYAEVRLNPLLLIAAIPVLILHISLYAVLNPNFAVAKFAFG